MNPRDVNILARVHTCGTNSWIQVFGRLFSKKEMRILMVGLDAAGKTTILYKLKVSLRLPACNCTHTMQNMYVRLFVANLHASTKSTYCAILHLLFNSFRVG